MAMPVRGLARGLFLNYFTFVQSAERLDARHGECIRTTDCHGAGGYWGIAWACCRAVGDVALPRALIGRTISAPRISSQIIHNKLLFAQQFTHRMPWSTC